MPSSSSSSSAITSNVVFDSVHRHTLANAFVDSHGRTLLLRGLNVSGDAKYPHPTPLAGTLAFYDVSNISYARRPFKSVAEAGEWWARLRSWGVGVVRLVVCWEALEPREMGVYDEEYINYLRMIVGKANETGLAVFIDGHQDVWSRFSGGSGAPLWTFHVAGLDPKTFQATCSAALDEPKTSSLHSTPSGRLWPTNYSKFAVATMFTLFFGGEVFAPKALCASPKSEFYGMNVGYVLRTSYTRAYSHLMARLKDLPNVLGIDPMNEPHPGYIGLPSLHCFNENTELHLGHMPNALQSMALAAGVPTRVPYFSRTWPHPSEHTRDDVLNEDRVTAWLPGRNDVWQDERVFTVNEDGASVQLGPKGETYFLKQPVTGKRVDFERDFYVPFIRSFHSSVKAAMAGGAAGTWLFVEPIPNLGPPVWSSPNFAAVGEEERVCYSPHWYDIRALYEKSLWYTVSFDVLSLAGGSRNFLKHTYFGSKGLTSNYAANFARFWKHLAVFRSGKPTPTPVLIGETGVPWDVNRQSAYMTGNIHTQLTMTNSLLSAMERNLLNYTFWNLSLTHSVSSTPRIKADNQTLASFQSGDGWNSEDFSIVSSDPASTELPLNSYDDIGLRPHDNGVPLNRASLFGDLYRGLRAAPAVLRPYPFKTAGRLLKAEFDMKHRRFEMEYRPSNPRSATSDLARTTEVFIPAYHFWGRPVAARFWVKKEGTVREVEWTFRWDIQDGGGIGLRWVWELGRQNLTVVHMGGFGREVVVGIALEALEAAGGVEKAGWWEGMSGWFV